MDEASVTPRQRRLAAELRALRHQAKLSGPDLAGRLQWSQSKVSKIENARTAPSVEDVERWAVETGATTEQSALLADLADEVTEVQSWRSLEVAGISKRQREIARMEATSTQIRGFQHGMIPGLLQTPEYTTALLNVARLGQAGDVDNIVAGRQVRQRVLQDPAKTFRFVVTEAALRAHYLPAGQIKGQLARLLEVEEMPNVTLGVLPLNLQPPVVYSDGFLIFDEPEQTTVLAETRSTELILRKAGDLQIFESAFEAAASAAVVGRRGRSLIRAALTAS